jgi:hypothetical protein
MIKCFLPDGALSLVNSETSKVHPDLIRKGHIGVFFIKDHKGFYALG